MNAAQLCEYFGWTDFATAKHYIRMAQKDLDNAIMQIQGIEPEEEDEVEDLRPAKCGECGEINPATRDYCQNCDHLISKQKELIRDSVRNEVKDEVKTDLIDTFLEEYNIPEEKSKTEGSNQSRAEDGGKRILIVRIIVIYKK